MVPVIIYIMGVSGSGKTTIGRLLSEKTGLPFFDADDFHPAANKEKMKAGIPLTDHDREGWLLSLQALARREARRQGAVIACSALKQKYRQVLEEGVTAPVQWVLLQGTYETILARLQSRNDHFMPPTLLRSQFDTLEIPADAIVVDIMLPPGEMVERILQNIEQ